MIDAVMKALRDLPGTALILGDAPEPVLLRGGPRLSRLTLVVLAGGRRPVLVAKIGHDQDAEERLGNEHLALRQLQSSQELAPTVPRPVGLLHLPGAVVQVQSAVPGTPMAALLRRQRLGRGRRAFPVGALQWLDRLQRHTATEPLPPPDPDRLSDQLAHTVPGRELASFRRAAVEGAEALDKLRLQGVRRHGDFWPGNLVCSRERMSVIDWEHSVGAASPVDDALFFLLTYHHTLPGKRRRSAARTRLDAFVEVWVDPPPGSPPWHGRLAPVSASWGADGAAMNVLLVDFLARMADDPTVGAAEEWRQMLKAYARSRHDGDMVDSSSRTRRVDTCES